MDLLLPSSFNTPFWISLGLVVVLFRWFSEKRQYPPGPRGLPIVNNLFDLPTSFEHVAYAKWGKKYGDVVYVSALGRQFVILNSIKAGNELLDQKSAIYSDRPSLGMIDLMGIECVFGLKRYSREWKLHRRLFTEHLNSAAVKVACRNQLLRSTNRLLQRIFNDSDNLRVHVLYWSASLILGIAYSYEVQESQDPLVAIADKALQTLGEGLQPKFLPNIWSGARYIPEWVPGIRFASFAKEAAKVHVQLREIPFDGCLQKISSSNCSPCFVQSALEKLDEPESEPMLRQAIKEVASVMYEAGVDSTASAAQSLLIQLILHPEMQRRAHEELDGVIGSPTSPHFRLPRFEDRPALPYIDALCQEILRFRPPAPRALPHAVMEDDIYRGWKIPKGAVIVQNAWAMRCDETVYANPEIFDPDRFIDTPSKPAEPRPSFAFGFGRRICPGQDLAEDSLWILTAFLLSAFEFTPAKDQRGNDINIEFAAGVRPGFIHDPGYFPCKVVPRSNIVENVIHESETGL